MSATNRFFTTQGRIVRTGFQNFGRNLTLAIAAIAVMAITLTIILFSVIANATFNNTIQQITDRIDVSVYLNDDVTTQQRGELVTALENLESVKTVEYISKDEALEAYKQANQDNPDLLLAISQTDNPLPATLRVKPSDPNRIDEIRQVLEQDAVKALQSDETSYSGDRKEAIDNITQATDFFQRAGLVGVVLFTVVSMLIIFNTIRMAIFNRRDELQIMRLLGANTNFIRGPFVVETVIYGIVAAAISIIICQSLFSFTATAFEASSFGLLDIAYASQYFSKHLWLILTIQLGAGILIGAVSSTIATRRYLKFKLSK